MPLNSRTLAVLARLCCLVILCVSCQESVVETRFRLLEASESGITFSNTIITSDTFNILNFHYIYNGGGVGIRDFNQDGLPDIVFSGNQVSSRLYLNLGGLQFRDITSESGMQTSGRWTTGISINDINGDGWPDIYFSVGGLACDRGQCNNLLFIHQGLDEQGLPIFKEQAQDFNLTDDRYTQQALFIDIDRDCDLDVYLLHNVIDNRDKNAPSPQHFIDPVSQDQLFRNDGPNGFVDVTAEYGIEGRGYGLGVAAGDFNRDGWLDIYVANDFLSSDLFFINQKGQGFEEVAKQVLKHQSYNSMGVDIADLNGDALAEIMVLDMLPETNERRKRTQGFMNYDKYRYSLQQGYAPQFVRNTLQLNSGRLDGEMIPFSDVSYQAQVYQTDWSWSPLFADYDNDGDQDLFVTNGYGKDITDLDFIKYSQQANAFGNARSVQETLLAALSEMPENKLQNYIFQQNSALVFEDQTNAWLPEIASISNGAAYADLDADGDLDLVVNNIDEPAYVLENTQQDGHYLQVKLESACPGSTAIGAQVHLWADGKRQYRFYSPVRGYLSTVDDVLHFGLGASTGIDSISVEWANGMKTTTYDVSADQRLVISQSNSPNVEFATLARSSSTVQQDTSWLQYTHQENPYQDYNVQPLLVTQFSRESPSLASGIIDNKKGTKGLLVGASNQHASILYYIDTKGQILQQISLLESKRIEVTDAQFFDADGDGDNDLYLVAGGAEVGPQVDFQDQLYLNDGQGVFSLATDRLPIIRSSGGCVAICDFDLDGDEDIFLGARLIPGEYPVSPSSVLLENREGVFREITANHFPALSELGLITDASWVDVNGDKRKDLVVVGEWMPIKVFLNTSSGFEALQDEILMNSDGLWQSITPVDLDQDGDLDFLIGNYGNNTPFQSNPDEPLTIVSEDLDKNGSIDPFLGKYFNNEEGQNLSFPYHARDDLVKQCPKIQQSYLHYRDFAQSTFSNLLKCLVASPPMMKKVFKMESIWLEMEDGHPIQLHDLPPAAQLSPIKDAAVLDIDNDRQLEIFLIGNDFGAEKNGGRYDSSNGLMLRLIDGQWATVPTSNSGFLVPGDARSIISMPFVDETLLLVSQNEDALLIFRHQYSSN